jgi:hypothetical protein
VPPAVIKPVLKTEICDGKYADYNVYSDVEYYMASSKVAVWQISLEMLF